MNSPIKSRLVGIGAAPSISSYPRSGSNFFSSEFKARTGVVLLMNHSRLYEDNIVSCIRNPLDSLASGIAMRLETSKQKTIQELGQEYFASQGEWFNEDSLNSRLDYNINQYELFYSYLDKSKNFIVDYETYKLKIESSIAKVASLFEIELISDPNPAGPGKDRPLDGYLVSSKGSEFYKRSLELVAKKDLTKANDLYLKCLEKSILG
jgi:hypothetical protein